MGAFLRAALSCLLLAANLGSTAAQNIFPRVEWFRSAPAVDSQPARAYSVNAGPNDSVYLTGAARLGLRFGDRILGDKLPNGIEGGFNGCIVAIYENSGALRFADFFRAPFGNETHYYHSADVDLNGNIAIAGDVSDNGGFYFARLFSVAPSGVLRWQRQWGGHVGAATVRSEGESSFRVLFPTFGRGFSPEANLLYVWNQSGSSNYLGSLPLSKFDSRPDGSFANAGIFSGTMAVGGEMFASRGAYDILVSHYTPNGLAWTRQLGASSDDRLRAIHSAHDSVYVVYTVGSTELGHVAKYSLSGDLLFDKEGAFRYSGAEASCVAVDGTLYVGGASNGIQIQRYTKDGDLIWSLESDSRGRLQQMDLDSVGRLLIAGTISGPGTIGAQQFDAAPGENLFVARVSVENLPSQPRVTIPSETVQVGVGATIAVEASAAGVGPFAWEWRKNNALLHNEQTFHRARVTGGCGDLPSHSDGTRRFRQSLSQH